jgi:hypothetical protein
MEDRGVIPDYLYLTGLGRLAYLALWLPLTIAVTVAAYAFLAHRNAGRTVRILAVAPLGLIIATAPLWDLYAIGVEAKRLCKEQSGLKVYRTVEAEGFVGSGLGKRLVEYGYQYVESGGDDKMSRYTARGGDIVYERITEFTSRYWVKSGDSHRVIGNHFSRSSDQVVDRQTGEVLGELVVIGIYPGWFDNVAIATTGGGSGFSPWRCGEEPPPGRTTELGLYDLIFATIHPPKPGKGERQ